MAGVIKKLLVNNFQRKLFSLFAALVIWIFVSNSITSTRVFPRVSIRVLGLPDNKTIRGMMPNGVLDRKITLTVTGTKDIVDQLDSQDFAVVIDAAGREDDWVVQVSKNNLVSLDPDIDLIHNITSVSQGTFFIHLSNLVTEKIPVYIVPPKGEGPEGYQFVDIWPQRLYQTVSGPEEDVKSLQEEGIEVAFDLSHISKADLDALSGTEDGLSDEVGFLVPESWKKVSIPFLHNAVQSLNGPEAKQLRIDFLRHAILPLPTPIPVRIYYPDSLIEQLNPETCAIVSGGVISDDRGVKRIAMPLYVSDVSHLFLEIVRDRLEILLVPEELHGKYFFSWQVQFIEPEQLENGYVAQMMPLETKNKGQEQKISSGGSLINPLARQYRVGYEKHIRTRFRDSMRRFRLRYGDGKPLGLGIHIDGGNVLVEGMGQPETSADEE